MTDTYLKASDPLSEPSGTEPSGTEPSGTEPSGAEPPGAELHRAGRATSRSYFYAVLCATLAVLARVLLTPYLGAQFPFATVYFAVTFVAWYGGLRPALLATLLGYLGVAYFVIPPLHSFWLQGLAAYIGAGIYLFVSLTSALFSEAQHKAQARAEASAREARRQEAAARDSEARKAAILETHQKSETRQRYLTHASDLLAASLDYQTTLQSVAQLVVPYLADWCVVHLLNEGGTLELVAAMHIDPAKVEVARESSRRYPPRKDEAGGLAAVARSGKAEWIEHISDGMLRATAQDDEHYRMLATSGMQSFLCVPLIARGKILGTLTFIGGESGHRYSADSLPFAEELARRAAIAVDNMLLFQAERERSEQLTLAIQEIHHRVKNNLQAVSALLEMQMEPGSVLLPVEAVHDSLSQIKTIALVHDLLARDKPMGQVNIAQVLTNLAALLSSGMLSSIHSGDQELPICVKAEPIWMPTKAATSLALAVNELLTNAAKHNTTRNNTPQNDIAHKKEDNDSHDAIEVSLQRQEETIVVVVQDHGPGFPTGFDPVANANIGLQLVLTLVEHDLRGAITFSSRAAQSDGETPHGGRVEIRFAERSVPE